MELLLHRLIHASIIIVSFGLDLFHWAKKKNKEKEDKKHGVIKRCA